VLKILVVEDSPDPASTLSSMFAALEGVAIVHVHGDSSEVARRVAEETPDLVLLTAASHRRLVEELAEACLHLGERKYVERAKGILMKQRGLDEEAAFAAIRALAMQRGLRLGEVARQLVDMAKLLG
jgi:AmiR/NasT family two-component response regulator